MGEKVRLEEKQRAVRKEGKRKLNKLPLLASLMKITNLLGSKELRTRKMAGNSYMSIMVGIGTLMKNKIGQCVQISIENSTKIYRFDGKICMSLPADTYCKQIYPTNSKIKKKSIIKPSKTNEIVS